MPMSGLVQTILSYDGNTMLAAIISLLVVILFVLLLHVYAKWFLAQSRDRSRSSVSVPNVLGARFRNFHSVNIDSGPPTRGLELSVVASLPLFVYDGSKCILECVICLSIFQEKEVGRKLPRCGHAFHIECIDMWLHSHSTCPICREIVVAGVVELTANEEERGELTEIVVEVPTVEQESGWLSGCSSSSQASSLGGSLMRIMSKNRSENKVHPSPNITEFNS